MWLEQIHQIAKLAQVRCQQKQLLIIAVDGCGGAGKSTLCKALAAKIDFWAHTQIIKLDDFYHPLTNVQQQNVHHSDAKKAYFDGNKFKRDLLTPLSQGVKASYKPVHWLEGQSDQRIEVLPKGVLILDGVFSFSKTLREMVHLSIFVDTPLLLRTQRMIARPQLDIGWVDHWQRTEFWHHQHESTATEVDFVVLGNQT
jgi:uridine kinase